MEGSDRKDEATPVILIVERRTQRQDDLDAADVMKIVRKRASLRKRSYGGSGGTSADG